MIAREFDAGAWINRLAAVLVNLKEMQEPYLQSAGAVSAMNARDWCAVSARGRFRCDCEGDRNAISVPEMGVLERSKRSAVAGCWLVVGERIVVHDIGLKKKAFDGLCGSNLIC